MPVTRFHDDGDMRVSNKVSEMPDALQFNGSGDALEIPDTEQLRSALSGNECTIAMWVSLGSNLNGNSVWWPWTVSNDSGSQTARLEHTSGGGNVYVRWIMDPASAGGASDGGAWARNLPDMTGQTFLHVSTFNRGRVRTYINDTLESEATYTDAPLADATSISNFVPQDDTHTIKSLSVYDRELTQSEVESLHKTEDANAGLVANWLLDDGASTTITDEAVADYYLDYDGTNEMYGPNSQIANAWDTGRDMTISFDVRIDSINNQNSNETLLRLGQHASSGAYFRLERDGTSDTTLVWRARAADDSTDHLLGRHNNVEVGGWYTLTLVVDYSSNNESRTYVNGVFDETVQQYSSPATEDFTQQYTSWNTDSWSSFTWGSSLSNRPEEFIVRSFNDWCDFSIRNLVTYDRVLSQSEVEDVHNERYPDNGVLQQYTIDEGFGNIITDFASGANATNSGGTWSQYAGGNDATKSGATWVFSNQDFWLEGRGDSHVDTELVEDGALHTDFAIGDGNLQVSGEFVEDETLKQ